ncbi:carbohydrate kinase [Caldalkalibacillus mannanilyticus]|uniref:carbohydrate kinase n=1 Tax=Caldalkalibacillus mannanilyticus TaxID=1418 RepID=UPI000468D242|nr:carbohydrate kinase [Caldalkalibacillus mannanilyticus]
MDIEQLILHHIKMNPYISQQDLASKVGLSRSAVANYISSLTRRGEIKGRAYVLKEESSIICIGGANIDRKAKTTQKARLYSSNPVTTSESCGGVARNVAENLSRLGCHPSLMTAVGEDKEGRWLIEQTKTLGIDVSKVWLMPTERTGTYTALIDVDGEMLVSMAEMNIYEKITTQFFEDHWASIKAAEAIFLDTNIPQECLSLLIMRSKEQNIRLFIDPVSSAKASKLPADLAGVELILPNREEAELLAGTKIDSVEDCALASQKIHERGVKNVIITLGEQGIYYSSTDETGHLLPYQADVVDVTGAGDAFAATVIYGLVQQETLSTSCRLGLAAARLTLQSAESVSPLLQPTKLYEIVKEFSS